MLRGWKSGLLVLAWGAFLGGFTFLAYTDFALVSNARWCGTGDIHCLREWVSALSGWAAAAVGGATLFALYAQIAEQRKQTSFVLGDANPTMDATYPTGRFEDVVLRIVNWNRQSAVIKGVRVSTQGAELNWLIEEVHTDNDIHAKDFSDLPARNIIIRGWIDRQGAPSTSKIFLYIAPKQGTWVDDMTVELRFEIDLLVLSEVHKPVTLTAFMTLNTDELTRTDWVR